MRKPTEAERVFAAADAWSVLNTGRMRVARITIHLEDGQKVSLPRPIGGPAVVAPTEEDWVPTAFQEEILRALEGKALRTDALGAAVGDRGRLYREPGGLKELQERGLVANHKRLGHYRPDAPPPDLDSSDQEN